MALLDWIVEKVTNNEALLLTSIAGAVLYCLMSQEPLKQRVVGALSGLLSAWLFAPPLAEFFSDGNGAHIYGGAIAMCGQFIPQLIQSLIQKFSKLKLMDKFGLKDDDNINH